MMLSVTTFTKAAMACPMGLLGMKDFSSDGTLGIDAFGTEVLELHRTNLRTFLFGLALEDLLSEQSGAVVFGVGRGKCNNDSKRSDILES